MSEPNPPQNTKSTLTAEDLWGQCLLYIKDRIPDHAYQTWFDGIIAAGMSNEGITLQVPNQFHYEWLESKYRHLIDNALKECAAHPLVVNYSVVISDKTIDEIPKLIEKEKPIPPGYQRKSQLNSRYIFENFIEGKSNQFAKAAAISVADTPGQTPYNPLLIYSNPGLGKTHLLQAIGNKILKQNKNMHVVYLTSEKFMLNFISSIQKNRSTEFANNYRNVDMFLLDDVQFFQGKKETQEQFFHLFNDLYQKGRQVVLTTDRHPNDLKGLKERLVSRFQSGLIVDIQPPDLETRIAILMKKAEDDSLEIPYDVTEFIASAIKGDIRAMEGALVKLLALSSLRREDITMSLAQQVLTNIIGDHSLEDITIDKILKYVCRKMKISERQVMGKSRTMNIALARQLAMYLSKELTSASLANIGSHIGGRDHSTVIHACKNIDKKALAESDFKRKLEVMKNEISGQ
ncbi:MAG: chromosomal replication initiator protein DnaA [Candidatus Marinimicrobia bacterium]|nr:chromosomal replication initiator protein DnaA [Candidatus Neomarinimicrobiota bacterium]MDP6936621.1 chromosomal replication initiator protein DnaA [Candidatus Neomarinimicrobiota bacterium]